MKLIRPYRCAALVLAACLAAVADAATVGRPQGPALIGRPLDLLVPIVLEGAGDAAPECAEADVFYGDQRVTPASVSTELQTTPRGPAVRVRTMAAINEPVITVYLQLGCGSRFTRRIVLLSEPDPAAEQSRPLSATARSEAAEAAANAAPLNLSMSRGLPGVQPGTADAQKAAAPKPAAPKRKPAARPKPATPAQAAAPSQAASSSRAAAPASSPAPAAAPTTAAPRDKLKLDLPVGLGEPSPSSEEALREAARLQAIERDLRDMRQFLQRNDSTMLQLHAQLVRAESERYSNPLVYVLLALVAVMAGFMAFLWRQSSRLQEAMAANWWRDPGSESGGRRVRVATETAAAVVRPAGAGPVSKAGDDEDDATDKPRSRLVSQAPEPMEVVSHEPAQPPTMHAPMHVSARTDGDFQPSQTGSRALKAEELHDVQQEADFFSSLGEYDRAIDVLRSHIQANPETSAVAWLDLVEIYHRLGRREDFDWVRREFQRRFNAKVPEFENYSLENSGIEAYDNAMQRIIALWPARRVLDVIEESIFRGPSKDGAQAFSLQAYRELLLLHHIGQQVLTESATHSGFHEEASEMVGGHSDFGAEGGFSHTSIHPLSTGLPGKDEGDGQGGAAVLDLDLNLDDAPAPSAGGAMLDFDLPEIDPALAAPSRTTRE